MSPSSTSTRAWRINLRILCAVILFLTTCAFGIASVVPLTDTSPISIQNINETLAVPDLSVQINAIENSPQSFFQVDKVHAGDTLATLLFRLGVNDGAAAQFIRSDSLARNILQLRPGKQIYARTNTLGLLGWLRYSVFDSRDNVLKNVLIERTRNGFKASAQIAQIEQRIEMHTAQIRSSLFAATDAAQIPDSVSMQLVDMFSTNINFATDLRKGDHFKVVYETSWQGDEYLHAGRILSAEFVNAGKTYQAIWFAEPGHPEGGAYYSFEGQSLKKAFLKSPLKFTRISSGFSMRLHPILGIWKQHKGVDFAAATGTPIHATADATVEFMGTQRGYGNVIVLKHWGQYSTLYGHMSGFNRALRKGMKVGQGELIGYVGSTGWATGPHLHYEFRISDKPHDPLALDIPNAQPLAGNALQQFKVVSAEMTHRFQLMDRGQKVSVLAQSGD